MPRTATEYIVDSRGRKKAGVVPVKEFDRLIEHLEELEDALALEEAVGSAEEFTDYRRIRAQLKNEGRL